MYAVRSVLSTNETKYSKMEMSWHDCVQFHRTDRYCINIGQRIRALLLAGGRTDGHDETNRWYWNAWNLMCDCRFMSVVICSAYDECQLFMLLIYRMRISQEGVRNVPKAEVLWRWNCNHTMCMKSLFPYYISRIPIHQLSVCIVLWPNRINFVKC
jgi:hypothetical protein